MLEKFKRWTRQKAQNSLRKLHDLDSLFFFSINLFEGVSVGLETDFHHLERVDDNRLSQARAEPRYRQRLEGRWT